MRGVLFSLDSVSLAFTDTRNFPHRHQSTLPFREMKLAQTKLDSVAVILIIGLVVGRAHSELQVIERREEMSS